MTGAEGIKALDEHLLTRSYITGCELILFHRGMNLFWDPVSTGRKLLEQTRLMTLLWTCSCYLSPTRSSSDQVEVMRACCVLAGTRHPAMTWQCIRPLTRPQTRSNTRMWLVGMTTSRRSSARGDGPPPITPTAELVSSILQRPRPYGRHST
jgi:hypothetical protein